MTFDRAGRYRVWFFYCHEPPSRWFSSPPDHVDLDLWRVQTETYACSLRGQPVVVTVVP